MMSAGRIMAEGNPADLIRQFGRQNMKDVFLAISRSEYTEMAEASQCPVL